MTVAIICSALLGLLVFGLGANVSRLRRSHGTASAIRPIQRTRFTGVVLTDGNNVVVCLADGLHVSTRMPARTPCSLLIQPVCTAERTTPMPMAKEIS